LHPGSVTVADYSERVLEIIYTCALVAVALGVAWYSAHIVRRLYKDGD
jgi:hypothetical protein